MAVPRTYKTEAIVLKHSNLGEADRILTVYTPNLGKIRAVAKGVRRTKSKLGGHVEPLTRCSLMLSRGKSLDVVSQAQTIESFDRIRSELWLTAHALYLFELTDAFTPERVESYPVYRLLIDCLHLLPRERNVGLLFRFFEVQLLGHVGYRPRLYHCLNCDSTVEPIQNWFSAGGGGVLCPSCAGTEPVAEPISVDALKVLRLLQRGDYALARRVRLSRELASELEHTMVGYLRYLLEREVRSVDFIERLRRETASPGSR